DRGRREARRAARGTRDTRGEAHAHTPGAAPRPTWLRASPPLGDRERRSHQGIGAVVSWRVRGDPERRHEADVECRSQPSPASDNRRHLKAESRQISCQVSVVSLACPIIYRMGSWYCWHYCLSHRRLLIRAASGRRHSTTSKVITKGTPNA